MTAQLNTRDRVVNDDSFYNQTSLTSKLAQGTVVHNITAGLEFGRDNSDVDNFTWTGLGTINLGAPVYRAKPASAVRAPNTVVASTVDSTALFFNDQIDLNKEWKLVGGLRWDRLKADYQSRVVSTGVTTKLARTDKVFSKRVGVIYQPDDLQSYYASFGTSFNPSAEAVTLSATTADIAPEKNRSMEIGAKLDFLEGNLTVNTALFRVEKDGRTTDPLTSVVTLSGESRVQGIEFGVVGRVTPALQLMAGYTYLDGKVVNSKDRTGSGTAASPYLYANGKTLSNTPEHNATLWAIYSFGGAWEAGGGLVYASDRFLNNYESAMTDGYTRVDASLAYRQKNYVVRFNVQNLTDKAYYETASAGRATPVKGRSLVASINYTF
jgi:catecholate siderophore receptor